MDNTKHLGTKSSPFQVTTLFKQEEKCSESGQVTYRIPSLIYISDNQTYIAFAEKRRTADDTDADVLVMRKGMWKDGEVEVRLATCFVLAICFSFYSYFGMYSI